MEINANFDVGIMKLNIDFDELRFCGDDLVKKESVVKALKHIEAAQTADLLFDELDRIESFNSTRCYINTVLKALGGFPLDLVEDGFERLLSDPKWSFKMKHKFRNVFEEIQHRAKLRRF